MLFTAMLVNALHAALENAEIAFNRVGVDVTAHILAFAVGREIVICKLRTKLAILFRFIGIDDCLFGKRFHAE